MAEAENEALVLVVAFFGISHRSGQLVQLQFDVLDLLLRVGGGSGRKSFADFGF